jgi:hypothetical protein
VKPGKNGEQGIQGIQGETGGEHKEIKVNLELMEYQDLVLQLEEICYISQMDYQHGHLKQMIIVNFLSQVALLAIANRSRPYCFLVQCYKTRMRFY